jgi:hypothetical protein
MASEAPGSKAIVRSSGGIVRYVIASGAKQSPTLRIEIALSLCSSQGHKCDLVRNSAFILRPGAILLARGIPVCYTARSRTVLWIWQQTRWFLRCSPG